MTSSPPKYPNRQIPLIRWKTQLKSFITSHFSKHRPDYFIYINKDEVQCQLCQNIFPDSLIDIHLSACSFVRIPCPFGCKRRVTRASVIKGHHQCQCPCFPQGMLPHGKDLVPISRTGLKPATILTEDSYLSDNQPYPQPPPAHLSPLIHSVPSTSTNTQTQTHHAHRPFHSPPHVAAGPVRAKAPDTTTQTPLHTHHTRHRRSLIQRVSASVRHLTRAPTCPQKQTRPTASSSATPQAPTTCPHCLAPIPQCGATAADAFAFHLLSCPRGGQLNPPHSPSACAGPVRRPPSIQCEACGAVYPPHQHMQHYQVCPQRPYLRPVACGVVGVGRDEPPPHSPPPQ